MRGWLLNIFESLHKKRAVPLRTILPFFFVIVFGCAFLLAPHSTFASWWNPADWVKDFISVLMISFASMIYMFGFFLVKIGVWYNSVLMGTGEITKVWGDMRNIALTAFGFIIIVIAVMNILKVKIDEWGVSRLIPRLALASFLVIISRYACLSLMNFANALANVVTSQLGLNIYQPFEMLGQTFSTFNPDVGSDGRLVASLMSLVVAVVAFAFLAVLAVVLLIRALFLVFLLVISPIAFALMVLPWTTKVFAKWWDMLVKWTFFYPMAIAILAVGVKISMGAQGQFYPNGVLSNTFPADLALFSTDLKPLLIQFSFSLIALITIPLAIFMPLSLLGGAGSAIRKGIGYAGGMASGKHHIPGLKYDPKSLRATGKGYLDKLSEKKIAGTGRMVRGALNSETIKNNRAASALLKNTGVGAVANELTKQERSKRAGDIKAMGLNKKLQENLRLESAERATGNMDGKWRVERKKFLRENPSMEGQYKTYKEFSQLHGDETAFFALAEDSREKGWIGLPDYGDANVNALANKDGFNLTGSPKQVEKFVDRSGKTLKTCSAKDLGNTATGAWNIDASKGPLSGYVATSKAKTDTAALPEEWYQKVATSDLKECDITKRGEIINMLKYAGAPVDRIKIIEDSVVKAKGGGPTQGPAQGSQGQGAGNGGQTNTRPPGGGGDGTSTWT